MSAAAVPEKTGKPTLMERILNGIETAGNKMPNPAILFLALCVIVILLSQVLYWADVKATYQVVEPPPVVTEEIHLAGSTEVSDVGPTEPQPASSYELKTETTKVKGLLTGEGVRYLFTSFVNNFRNFSAVAIMLVVMIGVGLAEAAGLIGALIRKLVGVSSASSLTFIIVLLGIISSVASDAGYLVLIPLGAAAFLSVGRHPLAGIAAAFAGVARGLRRELPDHAARRRADRDHERHERRGQPEHRHLPPTSTSASARRSSSRSCSRSSRRS